MDFVDTADSGQLSRATRILQLRLLRATRHYLLCASPARMRSQCCDAPAPVLTEPEYSGRTEFAPGLSARSETTHRILQHSLEVLSFYARKPLEELVNGGAILEILE